jgi:hypothetical protein
VPGDEVAHSVVEHLGPQGGLADHAGPHAEAGEVVVDCADDIVSERVAEDWLGPSAVQSAGVARQERGLLDGC